MKEAYDIHFAATIERAEKQILLARHGRRLLNLVDDTPIVPGDTRPPYQHGHQARQILNDAEEDLREWTPAFEPIPSSATDMGVNLMPGPGSTAGTSVAGGQDDTVGDSPRQGLITGGAKGQTEPSQSRDFSGSSTVVQPEPSVGYQQQV